MSDLIERKLKACQVKPIDTVPYSEELQALKQENARLKRLLKNCKSKIIYVKSVRSDARKIICDDIVSDIDEVINE